MIDKQEIIRFEELIAELFNNAKIRAPIHLSYGNEAQIIEIFKKINIENDWVCGTWRSHYQALLKGIPQDFLTEKIVNGKSMIMNFPQYKFLCSSIVGGIPSIATGLALSIKRKKSNERVWCWTGDMSAETGSWAEAYKYSLAHDLPITFIVEDNELSVLTPTKEVWGNNKWYIKNYNESISWYESKNLIYYRYKNNKYPHAGAGIRVQF